MIYMFSENNFKITLNLVPFHLQRASASSTIYFTQCLCPGTEGDGWFTSTVSSPYLQSADMDRRPRAIHGILLDCIPTFSVCLLRLGDSGLFGFHPFGIVQHHLNNSILHQGSKSEEQARNEPYVQGLHIRHLGKLSCKSGAL